MERVGHDSRSAVNKGMNGTMASEIDEIVNGEYYMGIWMADTNLGFEPSRRGRLLSLGFGLVNLFGRGLG